MYCFYHDDMDGRCAGYWVRRRHPDAQMVPVHYDQRFPMETLLPGEEVWIVDFSIPPEEMSLLLANGGRVVWIDHHKTAIDKYKSYQFQRPINGMRVVGIAGCVLTYLYLYIPGHHTDELLAEDPMKWSLLEDIPRFTRLIGDRDVWRWAYGAASRHFHLGMLAQDTHPNSHIWDELDTARELTEEKLITDGAAIDRYVRQRDAEYIGTFAFEAEFGPSRILVCNRGRTSSEVFGDRIKNYPFVATFVWSGDHFNVSLYSVHVDVSEIAKRYGGGGHRGAAGFSCEKLPFVAVESGTTLAKLVVCCWH